jgi:hypothetical protein
MTTAESTALLSALSTAVPPNVVSPAAVAVPAAGQVLIPEVASEQVKATETLLLFHPNGVEAGESACVIVGAVLSSLTTTEPVPVLPTRSLAVADFVTPIVLLATVSLDGVGPLAMPEPESVAVQAIVTSALFQPAAFRGGDVAPVTDGSVLSSEYEAVVVEVAPLQMPFPFTLSKAVTVTVCGPSPPPAVNVKVQGELPLD